LALYFECRINKKALLQTTFLAILPTGLEKEAWNSVFSRQYVNVYLLSEQCYARVKETINYFYHSFGEF